MNGEPKKKLDAVYKLMPFDPQIVEIEGSIVTRLPDKYKNKHKETKPRSTKTVSKYDVSVLSNLIVLLLDLMKCKDPAP